jgi:hypothetical protein
MSGSREAEESDRCFSLKNKYFAGMQVRHTADAPMTPGYRSIFLRIKHFIPPGNYQNLNRKS